MRRGILLALTLFGCSAESPTGPEHSNEVLIEAYAHCHAAHHNVSVAVEFSNERREYAEGVAKGWADIMGRRVTFYRPWVRSEDPTSHRLEMAAAHEVAHVAFMTLNEDVANFAAALAYREGGCR